MQRFQYEGGAELVLEILPAKRKLALVLQAPEHFVGVRLTAVELAELIVRLEDALSILNGETIE